MTAVPRQTEGVRWIQVLRGLAALLVVIGHSVLEARALNGRSGVPVREVWGYGVDVFFVISGFIMVHSAGKRFGGTRNAADFLLRRIIRIAPLYALATLGIVFMARIAPQTVNGQRPSGSDIASSLLFIPYARMTGEVVPVLPVGWTLNYEMLFYAFFALAMFVNFRSGMIALVIVLCGLATLGAALEPSAVVVSAWTNSIILEFVFGLGIGVLYRSGFRPSRSLLFIAGLLAVILSMAVISGNFQPSPRFLICGIPAATVVFTAVFAFAPTQGWLFASFAALGDASYSLYITHMYAIRPLKEEIHRLMPSGVPDLLFIGLAVIWACVFGFLVHKLIEVRMTEWLNRKLVRRGNPGPVPELEPAPMRPATTI